VGAANNENVGAEADEETVEAEDVLLLNEVRGPGGARNFPPPPLGLGAKADEVKVVAEDVEATMMEVRGGQREVGVTAAKPAALIEGAARSEEEKDGGGASEKEVEEEVTVSIVAMPGVSLGGGGGEAGGKGEGSSSAAPLEMARTRVSVNESVAGLMGRLLLPQTLACQLELSFTGQVLGSGSHYFHRKLLLM
jgi:hypothetical protein